MISTKNALLIMFLCTFIFLISCHTQKIKADQALSEMPTSAELLSLSAKTYHSLDTYSDNGVVITDFSSDAVNKSSEKKFKTVFSKVGKFRFEYREDDRLGGEDRYVVWKEGASVKSWWTVDQKVRIHQNIGNAIAGATGVSSGSAYTIPSVLMIEAAWKGRNWTSPHGTYRISDGTEEGIECFRIQRMTSTKANKADSIEPSATKGKETYWIRKDNYILIRIDEETDFGWLYTREKTTYSPVINKSIIDSAFAFGY